MRIGQINYLYTAPEYVVPLIIGLVAAFAYRIVWLGVLCTLTLALLLIFFRGWWGLPPKDPNAIMCPCDGRVMRVLDHKDLGLTQVSIFLNVHNNHVQYMPFSGTVERIVHKDGEFHPAYMFEKSQLNERTEMLLHTSFGKIVLVQIAGLVARRIVSLVKEGERVERGQPIGLIKLGSRVDLWLPRDKVAVLVQEGDRVYIGDVLGRWDS